MSNVNILSLSYSHNKVSFPHNFVYNAYNTLLSSLNRHGGGKVDAYKPENQEVNGSNPGSVKN